VRAAGRETAVTLATTVGIQYTPSAATLCLTGIAPTPDGGPLTAASGHGRFG